jgi:hypothetical protein
MILGHVTDLLAPRGEETFASKKKKEEEERRQVKESPAESGWISSVES